MHTIIRYTPEYKAAWQQFLATATNATFLHNRDYMEYHSSRFTDFSLMAYDNRSRLVAVLPANICGSELWSHRGLTYGGWLMAPKHNAPPLVLDLWHSALEMLRTEGVTTLHYKPVPWFYCTYPTEDDRYALWRLGATMEAAQTAAVIPLHAPWLLNGDARQSLRKAPGKGIKVNEEKELAPYWQMLNHRLDERYHTAPVHTLEEMELLRSRFPRNIKLYTSSVDGELLAGILVYVTPLVIHAQYISSTPRGRALKTLPAIMDRIISDHPECGYFDFGTSCEQNGLVLNNGLAEQKYGLGGRTALYTSWRLDLVSNRE